MTPISLDHGVQVHLQTRSITASMCISPISLSHGVQAHLQTRSITASKFALSWPPSAYLQTRSITASKFARSQPSSVSPNPLDYGLQVRKITALKYISKFTRSRCGETVELDGRQPIIHTPPHLAWHPGRLLENERFWLKQRMKRVLGYEGIPGHDKPHKLRGSMKACQGCVRPRPGKERVCISYNAMMSIYPRGSQIYTLCR